MKKRKTCSFQIIKSDIQLSQTRIKAQVQMATTKKARPKLENESSEEYIAYLKSSGILTEEMLSDSLVKINHNGEISSETDEEIKTKINQALEKRSKRVNIFVTSEFFDDIQVLKNFYADSSLSEIVVRLTQEYLNYIKDTDFWNELQKLDKLKKEREERFSDFLEYKTKTSSK